MTPQERCLARIIFKLKVHQANGIIFEQLFTQVMCYSRTGFLKIKPYGNQGDRGNDGYEKDYGRYFQIYSPEDPSSKIGEAIKKLAADFKNKLIPYWGA